MTYFLCAGQAPHGAMAGEDAIAFRPSARRVRRIGGSWKVTEGDHSILDFGDQEDDARKALGIISKYGFTRICFVGRPHPSMTYFRK